MKKESGVTDMLEIPNRERDLEAEAMKFYRDWQKILRMLDFEFTPAEAVYFKKLCRDVVRENDAIESQGGNMAMATTSEIFNRFCSDYYGLQISPESKFGDFRYVVELIKRKYRSEKEII